MNVGQRARGSSEGKMFTKTIKRKLVEKPCRGEPREKGRRTEFKEGSPQSLQASELKVVGAPLEYSVQE